MSGRRVTFLLLLQFTWFFLAGMVLPFLPLYLQELGVRGGRALPLLSGGLAAVSALALAIASPLWRRVARRSGLRALLTQSWAGLAAGILLMAFATAAWQLMAIRVVQGLLGAAGTLIVSLAVAAAGREDLARTLARLQIAMIAGSAAGPAAGGALLDAFGFEMLFFTSAAAALAASLVAALLLPNVYPRGEAEPESPPGLQTPKRPAAGRSLFFQAWFFFALQGATMMTGAIFILYVQEIAVGRPAATIGGLILASAGVAGSLGAIVVSRLELRRARGPALLALGLGASALVALQAASASVFALWWARSGQGLLGGGVRTAAQALLTALAPPVNRRRSYRAIEAFSAAGAVAGACAGGIVAALIGMRPVFVIAGLLLAAGGLLTFLASARASARADQGEGAPV